MPTTLTPDSAPATDTTAPANAPALQAVRALLAQERARAARALPSLDPDWRFLLALYEAELEGRALTPAQAAEAAALPPESIEPTADHFLSQDFLARRAPAAPLRLTEEACEHLAVWVHALNPVPGLTPYRATAAAPPPEPPPEPPG